MDRVSERRMDRTSGRLIPRLRRVAVVSTLLFGDLAAIALACVMAYLVRSLFGHLDSKLYLHFSPALGLFPLTFMYTGRYPGYGLNPVEQLRKTFRSTTLVWLLLIAFSLMFKVGDQLSRPVILGGWFLTLILVPLTHAGLRSLLSRTALWGEPVIILGAAKTAEVVVRRLVTNPDLGLRPVACLDDDPEKHGTSFAGVPVVGPLSMASELACAHLSGYSVVAMPGLKRLRLTQVVEELSRVFPHIIAIPDLLGLTSLWVEARDLQGVLGLELRQNLLSPWNRLLKRMLDLAITIPSLMALGPIILLLGALIKLNSPGPAFYGQEREGLDGQRIKVWKLRTMVPDAEKRLQEYLVQNPEAQREWNQHLKLREDPRIVPRVGHLLRRFSLDELPQLWNVLIGEMSLVGPRPFPEYHLAHFTPGFRSLRSRVLPGLTGIWQVSARAESDHQRTEELDTYYIRNWSLWFDVYLLARTITAVLFGKGAY